MSPTADLEFKQPSSLGVGSLIGISVKGKADRLTLSEVEQTVLLHGADSPEASEALDAFNSTLSERACNYMEEGKPLIALKMYRNLEQLLELHAFQHRNFYLFHVCFGIGQAF